MSNLTFSDKGWEDYRYFAVISKNTMAALSLTALVLEKPF